VALQHAALNGLSVSGRQGRSKAGIGYKSVTQVNESENRVVGEWQLFKPFIATEDTEKCSK
jgi:hypothetical protein